MDKEIWIWDILGPQDKCIRINMWESIEGVFLLSIIFLSLHVYI